MSISSKSINLAYNSEAKKMYVIINNVEGTDPIIRALQATVTALSGDDKITPINGLTLVTPNPDAKESLILPEEADTFEDAAKNGDGNETKTSADEAFAEENEKEPCLKNELDNPRDIPFPDAETVKSNESVSETAPMPATLVSVVFKIKSGVPAIGAAVKSKKATLNRADGTIETSDEHIIKMFDEAGLERMSK